MGQITWIFFDLGSTLVDESGVYESRIAYAVKATGMSRAAFMEKVYAAAETSPTAIRTAAQQCGVTLPEWDNSLERLYAPVESVLKRLAEKYCLGIIANQNPGTMERLAKWGIDRYFQVVTASAEAGCAKPDLRIFRLALKQAGCAPCEAVMVGDRLDNDIAPAKRLGMKTVWVRQGYAGYQKLGEESRRPDVCVDGIDELAGIFEDGERFL